jgi:predicted enzyme related to lactoylglutathione lyase
MSGVVRVSASPAFEAVLYAKDLGALAAFYQQVLEVAPTHEEATHVVLPVGGGRLWVHAIPAAFAASIVIARPPELREDAAVKLSFPVRSFAFARRLAERHGGGVAPPERAWESQGTWHLDAWDPEGNVFQIRASSA